MIASVKLVKLHFLIKSINDVKRHVGLQFIYFSRSWKFATLPAAFSRQTKIVFGSFRIRFVCLKFF